MTDTKKQTPMMVQYNAIKDRYKDCLLFYRLGDFYELFNEDAKIASQVLEIALTQRNKNAQVPVPMCGVPHHAANEYIKTLVDKGYKVAICEQLEDPRLVKGMVKRDVVQVYTPGTFMDLKNRDEKNNYYLACLLDIQGFQLAYVDVATGAIKVTSLSRKEELFTELGALNISELIYPAQMAEELLGGDLLEDLQNRFSFAFSPLEVSQVPDGADILAAVTSPAQKEAVRFLLAYLQETQMRELNHLQAVEPYQVDHYLVLDYNARYNLEIMASTRTNQKKGSLLWLLDQTKTAMGGRMLRTWLEKPLIHASAIEERLDRVENLMANYFERMDMIQLLKGIYDLERLVAKASFGSLNPRELIMLKQSLEQMPSLRAYLQAINTAGVWDSLLLDIQDFSDLVAAIDAAILDEPELSPKEGGIIKPGYNEQLDRYHEAMTNGKTWMANLVAQEKELTGIKNLKVGYNKVSGYYIEVTNGQLHLLPEGRYERKQTLTNAERFVTKELKEKESLILEAQEKATELEYQLFVAVRDLVKTQASPLQTLARAIASLDVLAAFASVSEDYHYTRPRFTTGRDIVLLEGRHPVVEKVIGIDKYVHNDLRMGQSDRILLMTGPNMSGKSTYMRQIALTVIMAQVGCFVSAQEATLPVFDRIFTRIGAADDLISGQSTFMVEMMETNLALQEATANSLLLFDEIGRGTATFDGMALAEAILRYVHDKLQAKAIFSTHYHELTVLEESLSDLSNIHVGAIEQQGQLIFLHKIQPGPADKSYGIHVAQLAGLPKSLLAEASHILANLEAQSDLKNVFSTSLEDRQEAKAGQASSPQQTQVQTSVLSPSQEGVLDRLAQLDINQLTPLQALLELQDLISQAKA